MRLTVAFCVAVSLTSSASVSWASLNTCRFEGSSFEIEYGRRWQLVSAKLLRDVQGEREEEKATTTYHSCSTAQLSAMLYLSTQADLPVSRSPRTAVDG